MSGAEGWIARSMYGPQLEQMSANLKKAADSLAKTEALLAKMPKRMPLLWEGDQA